MRRSLLSAVFMLCCSGPVMAALFTDDALVQRVTRLEQKQTVLVQQADAMSLALDHERLKDLQATEDKKAHQDSWSGRWNTFMHQYEEEKRLWQSQMQLSNKSLEKMSSLLKQLQNDTTTLFQKCAELEAKIAHLESMSPDRLFYQQALQAIQKGHPDTAEFLLSTLLTLYPQSPQLSDRQYWYGIAAVMNHHYRVAIPALSAFVKAEPKSDKLPTALLSLHDAYHALGQQADAQAYAYRLLHEYPHSEAAHSLKKHPKPSKTAAKSPPKTKVSKPVSEVSVAHVSSSTVVLHHDSDGSLQKETIKKAKDSAKPI